MIGLAGKGGKVVDVSVIILTYNEEKHLERCIRSVLPFAKAVYIVDCHSKDRTAEIAQSLGVQVVQKDWPNNHAIQFNWALDHLPIDTAWVMRMDADEYVRPELADEIARRLPTLPADVTGINLRRRVVFLDRWIRFGGYYPTILLRMFRRGMGRSEQRLMDEHLRVTAGRTITFDKDIVDHNVNDITWWTDKHNRYATREALAILVERGAVPQQDEAFSASTRQAERKRWLKHNVYLKLPMAGRALLYFGYRYVLRFGFLDGRPGLIWHTLQGFWYRFLVDVKQLEIERMMREEKLSLEQVAARYGIRLSEPAPANRHTAG